MSTAAFSLSSLAVLALCAATLSACAYDPTTKSTEALCKAYALPLDPYGDKPGIRAELSRRNASSCLDPANVATRRNTALASGFLGPIAGAIHSAANPLPPIEDDATRRAATDHEIAQARREQGERQRREVIASMLARGASDEEIRKALDGTTSN